MLWTLRRNSLSGRFRRQKKKISKVMYMRCEPGDRPTDFWDLLSWHFCQSEGEDSARVTGRNVHLFLDALGWGELPCVHPFPGEWGLARPRSPVLERPSR